MFVGVAPHSQKNKPWYDWHQNRHEHPIVIHNQCNFNTDKPYSNICMHVQHDLCFFAISYFFVFYFTNIFRTASMYHCLSVALLLHFSRGLWLKVACQVSSQALAYMLEMFSRWQARVACRWNIAFPYLFSSVGLKQEIPKEPQLLYFGTKNFEQFRFQSI